MKKKIKVVYNNFKMKKRDETIIRIGDRVKITNPAIFVRCGYPMTMDDALRNHMTKSDIDKIDDLLRGVGITNSESYYFLSPSKPSRLYEATFDKIARALAYGIVGTKQFGGNNREIHTELIPSFKDLECVVTGKRIVKTGIRKYDSDDDWESGYHSHWFYLDKEKTHIIYKLRWINRKNYITSCSYDRNPIDEYRNGILAEDDLMQYDFEIEKPNVEKL